MSGQEQELAALMANTFLLSTHEERVERGTWALIAGAALRWHRAELDRVVTSLLAEKRPDHVAEADALRKQRQG